MFTEIGLGELLLICLIALLFIGLDDFCLFLRAFGRIFFRLKRQWEVFCFELNQEVDQRINQNHEKQQMPLKRKSRLES